MDEVIEWVNGVNSLKHDNHDMVVWMDTETSVHALQKQIKCVQHEIFLRNCHNFVYR